MSLVAGARTIPYIDHEACLACQKCMARSVCRTKAIRAIDPGEPPYIDGALCMGCMDCVPVCPAHAVIRPKVQVQGT